MQPKLSILYCGILAISAFAAAKATDKPRVAVNTAYYQSTSGTWRSVTLDYSMFEALNSWDEQAALRDNGAVLRLLYATQGTSTPVRFDCP